MSYLRASYSSRDSRLKMLWIHDNRRNLAPNIVNRSPIIYPQDNNGGVLPPYVKFGGPAKPPYFTFGP